MGCEATDRLAEALGGKTFLPVALPLIQQSAAHASWVHRHAALSMLAEMAMGCSKFMKPKATEVLRVFLVGVMGADSQAVALFLYPY